MVTADGDKRIDQIAVGDYVWAEDTVTGEQVLKRVLKVYVKESDHLIHIGTSVGEDIETTENHPFYIDGRGWVAGNIKHFPSKPFIVTARDFLNL